MSSFAPPLSAEPFHTVAAIAQRAHCSREAIYSFIHGGKIKAVQVAGRYLIAETEAARFIREWPSNNRGVSNRWREYRQWKTAQSHEAVA